jgi:hypothetical protein
MTNYADSIKYRQTEIYCPNCGIQGVWIDTLEDYYLGATGYCLSCNMYHHNAGDFYKMDKSIDTTKFKEVYNAAGKKSTT